MHNSTPSSSCESGMGPCQHTERVNHEAFLIQGQNGLVVKWFIWERLCSCTRTILCDDVNFLLRFRKRRSCHLIFLLKIVCPVDDKAYERPLRGLTVSTVVGGWPVGWGRTWMGGPCPQSGAHSHTDSQPWQHMSPENCGGSELLIANVFQGKMGRGMFQTMLNADMNLFRRFQSPLCWDPQLCLSLRPARRSHFWTSRENKTVNLVSFPSPLSLLPCSPRS